ncbi:hypothetical protein QJS10_CPB19g00579 [Acorus calamus]|uniref:Protein SPT2 homolog n=1 Tax=Acorus calamus TaxID=4465 RepID=A0AAV9CE80_ACOCL|nr:hypothetical protein QJS10_CPB19g00579 [Acorus calamus]
MLSHRNAMHRREDEYDGYDDYEDEEEGEEEDDYEEKEEERKPTKEELEYLSLRERLKEKFRQRMKKECSDSVGKLVQSKDKKRMPNDNFGSFFGPSQPVIASRVLQESRSVLETQHLSTKVPGLSTKNKKVPVSTSGELSASAHNKPVKPVNQFKTKVEHLKDSRDYSFLLSDDVEPPVRKDPAPRKAVLPTSADARSAQVVPREKSTVNKPARPAITGREVRNSGHTDRHIQSKVVQPKAALMSKPKLSSGDPRKVLGSNVGKGPGRPVPQKALPSKVPAKTTDMKKNSSVNQNRPNPASQKMASSTKPQASVQKHYPEQRREISGVAKPKVVPKQAVSTSKPQMKPPKQIPPRSRIDDRPKKRPLNRYADDDEDGEDAINMIRQMFGYNPNRYAGRDDYDDDSDMEANFEDIQREERRSAKIAKREDEIELQRILAEEEEEERRRKAKKRKLSGH